MKSKNKYLALGLLLSFINCDLFMNDEIKEKSLGLFDKVHSVLDASAKSISNNKNGKFSQDVVSGDITSGLQNDVQKDIQVALSSTTFETGEAKIQKQQDVESENSITKVSKVYSNVINGLTGGKPLRGTEKEVNYPNVDDGEATSVEIHHNSYLNGFGSTSSSSIQGEIWDSSNFFEVTYNSAYNSEPELSGQNSLSEDYYEEDDDDYDNEHENSYEEDDEDYEGYYDNYDKKESEEKYDKDEYDEEEERLDREYKLRSKNTKDSVKKAFKLAIQIEKDWGTVEFHKTKLNPIYGIRATSDEKQKSQRKLSKFNKNKLIESLTKFLNAIEESLNNADALTNIPEYPGSFAKDLQAKAKLDRLKTEIKTLISKVQKSNKTNYQSYEEIGSSIASSPKIKSELKQVLALLYSLTGAR